MSIESIEKANEKAFKSFKEFCYDDAVEELKNKVREEGRKQGALEELDKIWLLCEKGNMQTDDISRIAIYILSRYEKLYEGENK